MRNMKLVWTGRIIGGLVCCLFLFSATSKLFYTQMFPQMPQEMEKMGLPMNILLPIGILEIMCVVVYLVPVTSVLGAVLFTGYLGGAILTHVRLGEPVYMHIFLGLMIWLGIYLREPRLHSILPFRKKHVPS